MLNKKSQIAEGIVALLAVTVFAFAFVQLIGYRNDLSKSAYELGDIEGAFVKEEYFKQVVTDALEDFSVGFAGRKGFVGPPVEPRDLTDSDEEYIMRRFGEAIEKKIKEDEEENKKLSSSGINALDIENRYSIAEQLNQLKLMLQNKEFRFRYDGKTLELEVKGIIFSYGIERFLREGYKGREITLVYKKDFVFITRIDELNTDVSLEKEEIIDATNGDFQEVKEEVIVLNKEFSNGIEKQFIYVGDKNNDDRVNTGVYLSKNKVWA